MQFYRRRVEATHLDTQQTQTLEQQYRSGHYIQLNYEMRQRSRFRATCQDGQVVGVDLPRTATLKHGDIIMADSGELLQVMAAPQPLFQVTAVDHFDLMRAAYHLGNRHVPLMLSQDHHTMSLYFEPDNVLADMLCQLGVKVAHIEGLFEPETGAYQHHHATSPLAPPPNLHKSEPHLKHMHWVKSDSPPSDC